MEKTVHKVEIRLRKGRPTQVTIHSGYRDGFWYRSVHHLEKPADLAGEFEIHANMAQVSRTSYIRAKAHEVLDPAIGESGTYTQKEEKS